MTGLGSPHDGPIEAIHRIHNSEFEGLLGTSRGLILSSGDGGRTWGVVSELSGFIETDEDPEGITQREGTSFSDSDQGVFVVLNSQTVMISRDFGESSDVFSVDLHEEPRDIALVSSTLLIAFDQSIVRFEILPNGIDFIDRIELDEPIVDIAAEGRSVVVITTETLLHAELGGRFEPLIDVSGENFRSVELDEEGKIWILTDRGLAMYNPDERGLTEIFRRASGPVDVGSLIIDSEQRAYWVEGGRLMEYEFLCEAAPLSTDFEEFPRVFRDAPRRRRVLRGFLPTITFRYAFSDEQRALVISLNWSLGIKSPGDMIGWQDLLQETWEHENWARFQIMTSWETWLDGRGSLSLSVTESNDAILRRAVAALRAWQEVLILDLVP